ncbi:MAG: hypothetical protein ACJAZ9_000534 [Neolewinella sp.]|jgi:hypothetical protein
MLGFRKLWKSIVEWGKPVYKEHPFFGLVVDNDTFVTVQRLFPPLQYVVELLVDVDGTGKNEHAETWYKWIVANYLTIAIAAKRTHLEAMVHWEAAPPEADYENSLHLEAITIPVEAFSSSGRWSLSYYDDKYLCHWLTLEMKGLRVVEYMVDG